VWPELEPITVHESTRKLISEIYSFSVIPAELNDGKHDSYYPLQEFTNNEMNATSSPSE
jgi:hypothetical protein